MKEQPKIANIIRRLIAKGYNVSLRDMHEIDLGFEVELAKKMIGKAGFNRCCPTNKGLSIYQGRIVYFRGKDILNALMKADRWTKKELRLMLGSDKE